MPVVLRKKRSARLKIKGLPFGHVAMAFNVEFSGIGCCNVHLTLDKNAYMHHKLQRR